MEHKLSTIGLYILSGAPGSGKSTFVKNFKNLPKEAVVSSDSIRQQIFGVTQSFNNKIDKPANILNSNADKTIFSIMEQIVNERLREKLVTVVDSTNTTEKERQFWEKIANKYGIPSTVIIFDENHDVLVERDSKRTNYVGEEVITKFKERLLLDSSIPFIKYSSNDTYVLTPPTLPKNVDVIGDTHGLLEDATELLSDLGYKINKEGFLEHKEDRKILFLGDWTDRGLKSIELFDLIHKSVTLGGHFAVPGNHEQKLLKIYDKWKNEGLYTPKSFSGSETMVSFWENVPSEKLDNWMNWIRSLPHYYTKDRFVFCHGDLASFDKYQLWLSSALYGQSQRGKLNTDDSFTNISQQEGFSGPILVRGHIPEISESKSTRVLSLEEKVGFSGTIKSLPLDKAITAANPKHWVANSSDIKKGISKKAQINTFDKYVMGKLKELVKVKKTEFNYSIHQKNAMVHLVSFKELSDLQKVDLSMHPKYGFTIINEKSNNMTPKQKEELATLESKKLVQHKTNEEGLEIYKYSKKVFFDALWDESPLLLHTRGLVLDAAGKIIQNPFVKIFNYGEKGAGSDLLDSHLVQAVEKMNGFLGCVTHHPYEKENLLVTTTGSFDSPFVGYIKDFIDPKRQELLNNHCKEMNQTLMFEVIHPSDPHIIPYEESDHGLYLIGARGKELNSPLVSEETLDEYAKNLGLKRPKYFNTTLGEIRKLADEVKHEGYIVRDLESGEPLLKFKTSHYLTVKFLGRMGQGQSKLMFEKPEFFKQKIDEEYYPIVDLIVKKSNFNDFIAMKSEERVPFVHSLIKEMWEDIHPSEVKTNKIKP